ncbi:MAG TPA: LytTR family DNA-binding domain-containing protein [Daejeonella sp.]|jgi:two-component system LytT family response regulator|uniref:LytR/AlgR family response regulator transcription factor n=1 Tax=Daejeonella sp. TaxID=2805397 RepID=UPI002ED83F8B
MLLNAIIVDDEEYSRKSLFFLIDGYCPKVKIRGIAKSVQEARQMLKSNEIDLVFLDIAMPNEDGFGLLPDLQKISGSVIFTTAHNQYALRALKASAVDYLLKPVDIDELNEAIEKAVTWKGLNQTNNPNSPDHSLQLNSLEENLNEIKKITKLNLPHLNGFNILNVNSIIYVEADSNYSIFHLENQGRVVVSKHLKEYEEILINTGFSRIHKSTIINLKHLKNYSNKNGLIVSMSDTSEHTVSRRRVSDFLETVRLFYNNE